MYFIRGKYFSIQCRSQCSGCLFGGVGVSVVCQLLCVATSLLSAHFLSGSFFFRGYPENIFSYIYTSKSSNEPPPGSDRCLGYTPPPILDKIILIVSERDLENLRLQQTRAMATYQSNLYDNSQPIYVQTVTGNAVPFSNKTALPRWGKPDLIPVGFPVVDASLPQEKCTCAFPEYSGTDLAKVTRCREMRGDNFAGAVKHLCEYRAKEDSLACKPSVAQNLHNVGVGFGFFN